MQHNEVLLGNVLVRLLGLYAQTVAEFSFLCARVKAIPGLPDGFFDGLLDKNLVVEKQLEKDSDRVLYEILRAFGNGLRGTAPDLVEFSALADELQEYATRFDPAKETISGHSASPSNPEEEWLRRALDRLDPPDGIK